MSKVPSCDDEQTPTEQVLIQGNDCVCHNNEQPALHPTDIFYKCCEINNLKRKHMFRIRLRCVPSSVDCLQSHSILQPVIYADVSLTPSFLLDQVPYFHDVFLTRLSLGTDISLLAAHCDVGGRAFSE